MSHLTADLLHFLLQLLRGFVTLDVVVVEAIGSAIGIEPMNKGFADQLDHLLIQ